MDAVMKKMIFAALIGMSFLTGGCVRTVSDTHSPSVSFAKDRVEGRYERSIDVVYRAAFTVMGQQGVVVTEFIPHDTATNVRSLQAKVDQCNVWVRVSAEDDPKITSIVVEARTKWGNSNIDLAHELEKEIALQLAR
jgi:outer membrane murein-binding lipoprotein Lpp